MKKSLNILFVIGLIILSAHGMAQNKSSITIKVNETVDTINRNIYGHFAEHLGNCIYGGIWVGDDSTIPNTRGIRNDVVEALKEIDVPVIRWPGGCFADIYHWKDGIGPRNQRPKLINTTWGGVLEDNSFGTHEFLDFCQQINAEPYLAVNVGSGTVQDAVEWIQYVTADDGSPMSELRKANGQEKPWPVKYWGIGNESWGCGGNMEPAYYTSLFKQYATFCKVPYRIASGGIDTDLNWTDTFMKGIQNMTWIAQGYSFHYYSITHTWEHKGDAVKFDKNEWLLTMKAVDKVEKELDAQIAIMDKYDPARKVAIIADEWGNWFDVEPGTNPAFLYQQNTLRDAISAGHYLNIFNNHCQRVKMANIAQTVNVLQSMILTKNEHIVLTPTYYVFKMYKVHQNAALLPFELKSDQLSIGEENINAISVSSSKDKLGVVHITITNMDPDKSCDISCVLEGLKANSTVAAEIITADALNAFNDFGKAEVVSLKPFQGVELKKDKLKLVIPAKSVIGITIK